MSTKRDRIKQKFGGRCAYSGTPLGEDWQVEHIIPLRRGWFGIPTVSGACNKENLIPVQKIINHYKHSLDLETFRRHYLGGLHKRLKKLPKNPRTEKSKRRKKYLLRVASYFGITAEKPFSGKFYFETIGNRVSDGGAQI